jgi:AraC-like DNA-binding protein
MDHYITETLDKARCLLNVGLQEGEDAFVAALARHAHLVTDLHAEDPQAANRQLMALSSSLLAILFEGRTEAIVRSQLRISEAFIHEPTLALKLERFQSGITQVVLPCLDAFAHQSLADQLALFLQVCPLSELREATVASLAEHFAHHPDHFCKKIKQTSGSLPSDLIRAEKVRRAVMLIQALSGRANLKEIAFKVGFTDYPHFRDIIKAQLGVVPSRL